MAHRVIDGVVLVTGASSGIGAEMAARFRARGARVIISGRDRVRLESVAARHPGMSVVVMDVADPRSDCSRSSIAATDGRPPSRSCTYAELERPVRLNLADVLTSS